MAHVHYMKNSEWTLIKWTKTKRMVRVIDSKLGFYIIFFICHASQRQNNNNNNNKLCKDFMFIALSIDRLIKRWISIHFIIYFILEVKCVLFYGRAYRAKPCMHGKWSDRTEKQRRIFGSVDEEKCSNCSNVQMLTGL